MTIDVVIAGAGPVGAMLAAELRLAGVRTVVLERLPRPSGHSRAFRLQARTLELLDQRGLYERFAAGNLVWGKAHFAGIQPLLQLSELDSAHPACLLIPQAKTEALLAEHAQALGAEIRRGHQVTGIRQGAGGVTVAVSGPDGPYELAAGWLVGCDGGRSTVRGLAGIPFPGTGGSASALLGDVTLDDPAALPMGVPGTLRTRAGLLMAVSLEGGVTRILTTEFGRPAADRDAAVTLDELRAAVHRITGNDVELREPRWLSRFTDATRLATSYRAGRVLLAGDAAHVHFPIGAQGLNLGLADAVNLGWKLAAVVHGTAPDGLLDTYQAERQPAARRVLRETQAQLALMNPDERIDPLREFLGELLAIPEVNRYVSAVVTGLDVRYGAGSDGHPLVGARAPELTVTTADGERRLAELLHAGRPVLLDLAGGRYAAVAQAWAGRVDTVVATGNIGHAALLVRPDGYLAWVADDGAAENGDGLRGALARWFGAPGGRGRAAA